MADMSASHRYGFGMARSLHDMPDWTRDPDMHIIGLQDAKLDQGDPGYLPCVERRY